MKGKTGFAYGYIIFQELIYEYSPLVKEQVEKKIKRRLKYYKLGPYSQERVDYIRNLKEELASEIRLGRSSNYFKKTKSEFAEVDDFNIKEMVNDYALRYTEISKRDLRDMIGWGVHMFHTR